MIKRLFALLSLVMVFQACHIGYTLNGSALDYSIYKTISISQFPIRAALVYPPLQQTFENQLNNMIEPNASPRD